MAGEDKPGLKLARHYTNFTLNRFGLIPSPAKNDRSTLAKIKIKDITIKVAGASSEMQDRRQEDLAFRFMGEFDVYSTITFEPEISRQQALQSITDLLKKEDKTVGDLAALVNTIYKFSDE